MDILSSDLLMSLFVTALHSYKHDSLVRPFPPGFMKNKDEKDFEELIKAAKEIPPLYEVVYDDAKQMHHMALKLLKWIIKPKRFKLKVASLRKFEEIGGLVGESYDSTVPRPDFIFEVLHDQQLDDKFKVLGAGNDVLYAFHGSNTENFFSILHTGLRNNLNKVSLYGEGIYLSSDIRVCQSYSRSSANWERSLLGPSLSCIAVCEVIDHADVKCSVKRSFSNVPSTDDSDKDGMRELRARNTSNNGETSLTNAQDSSLEKGVVKATQMTKKRSFIAGSEGGKIPDRYYVVRNDDLVRIKYVFVYAPEAKKSMIVQLLVGKKPRADLIEPGVIRNFLYRNKFLLLMLLYVLILVFISLWNSKSFSKWWDQVMRKNEKDSVVLP